MYTFAIVEDEPIELESLHKIIATELENSTIHEASTGRKAMALIDSLPHIDMILVDINIPLPNGIQVIGHLRQTHRDTKVVVITANDDFELMRAMINLKIDDYLLKPVKPSTLIETMKKYLSIDAQQLKSDSQFKKQVQQLLEAGQPALWSDFMLDHLCAAPSSFLANILNWLVHYSESHINDDAITTPLKNWHKNLAAVPVTPKNYLKQLKSLLRLSLQILQARQQRLDESPSFVLRAQNYIEERLFERVTLDETAAYAFVSPCYLSRVFKQETKQSFSAYITSRKLRIAEALLKNSDLSIGAIALELGYQDANYFCRIFKRHTNLAPSDYRQHHQDEFVT